MYVSCYIPSFMTTVSWPGSFLMWTAIVTVFYGMREVQRERVCQGMTIARYEGCQVLLYAGANHDSFELAVPHESMCAIKKGLGPPTPLLLSRHSDWFPRFGGGPTSFCDGGRSMRPTINWIYTK